MAEAQKPRREPQWFDDSKTHLFAQPLVDGARSPRLRVKKDNNNNPVIEVDLGMMTEPKNPGGKAYPIKIETNMSIRPFKELMALIARIAAYKGPIAFETTNWGHPFLWNNELKKNVRSEERMVISRFQIAKREDGLVTFGVTAKGKKDVTFEFKSDEFHPVTQDGQTVPVTVTSGISAASWAELMNDGFRQDFVAGWVEPEFQKKRRLENMAKAQAGQQGNSNSYQQQRPPQQQAAPQQSAPASGPDNGFDDDIPF